MPEPNTSIPPADPAPARRRLWLGLLVIVLLTFVAYQPAIHGGFIWDDDDYVTGNVLLHDLAGLLLIWEPGNTHQYYPLVFTTFWLEYQFWQLNPLGYHIVNVLLHIAAALLVWRLMRLLNVPGAWMIAAVFALHPVHVESVAWITERKNVLSGLFYSLAALAYLRFDPMRDEETTGRPEGRRWRAYALALVLFVCALLSKSVTCSLPAALILVMFFRRQRMTIGRLLPLAPLFVIGLAAAMHTAHLERVSVGAEGVEFAYPFIERCLIASRALLFYPWKLLWPHPLIFTYPQWTIDAGDWMSYWPIAAVLLIAAAVIWLLVRGRRGPFVAAAFYAGTIFPALGFFNIYPMRYSFVADHFTYLASLGIIALVVGVLTAFLRRLRAAVPIAGAVLVVCAALVWIEGIKYESPEVLWRATAAANPRAWMAQNNLGGILLRDHRQIEEAIAFLQRGQPQFAAAALEQAESSLVRRTAGPAGRVQPAQVDQMIGTLRELQQGIIDEAIDRFRASLDAYPDHYEARGNLALALDRLGRYDEALAQWEQVVANPRAVAQDHYRMAETLEHAGRKEEAVERFREGLRLFEGHLASRLQLGELLVELGRPDEAQEHFEYIVQRDPGNTRLQRYLGGRAEMAGDYAAAIGYYEAGLEHTPQGRDPLGFMVRLAKIRAMCPDHRFRDPRQAIGLARRLLELIGARDPFVLNILAAGFAGLGRFDDAIRVAEDALALAEETGQAQLVAEIESRLAAYRGGRPDPP